MPARLLHQASIPSAIFEDETSINYCSPGGSLDLWKTTGLAAVEAVGPGEQFLAHARYDGESLFVTDKNFDNVDEAEFGNQGQPQRCSRSARHHPRGEVGLEACVRTINRFIRFGALI